MHFPNDQWGWAPFYCVFQTSLLWSLLLIFQMKYLSFAYSQNSLYTLDISLLLMFQRSLPWSFHSLCCLPMTWRSWFLLCLNLTIISFVAHLYMTCFKKYFLTCSKKFKFPRCTDKAWNIVYRSLGENACLFQFTQSIHRTVINCIM